MMQYITGSLLPKQPKDAYLTCTTHTQFKLQYDTLSSGMKKKI